MQEEATEIGCSGSVHRVLHSLITIPFLILEGIWAYVLLSLIPAKTGFSLGWGAYFILLLWFLIYFIVLAILTKEDTVGIVIEGDKLTYIRRTILLTIPIQEESVLLWKIASIYRDDDYLYLYDKRHKVLLKISCKRIEAKKVADELKRFLPDIKHLHYSRVANLTSTYRMSDSCIIIFILLWAVIGGVILRYREVFGNILYFGIMWVAFLWYWIYCSSQKVVIDKGQLTYTKRTFFFATIEKTIKISDIASMDGNKYEIWLYDKNENKLMDIDKNVFYLGKLTRALEILISDREPEPEIP